MLEDLSPELMDMVAGYASAERLTFESIFVRQLNDVSKILNHRRFSDVRHLEYDLELDILSGLRHKLPLPDSLGILQLNSAELADREICITAVIRDLLEFLEINAKDNKNHPGLTLVLTGGFNCLRAYHALPEDIHPLDERHMKRVWAQLREDTMPKSLTAPIVRVLDMQLNPWLSEAVWPASWLWIVSRFPNILKLNAAVEDDERKAIQSRFDARRAFGADLRVFEALNHLSEVDLQYLCETPRNQFTDPPQLCDPILGYDLFTRQLGIYSQQLTRLAVRSTTVDLAEFFETDGQWPNLRDLDFMEQQPASPNGLWYFSLDSRIDLQTFRAEEIDEDEPTLDELLAQEEIGSIRGEDIRASMDRGTALFRTVMDAAHFQNIYTAAAKAVCRMPKIRSFSLDFDITGDAGFGPGRHCFHLCSGTMLENDMPNHQLPPEFPMPQDVHMVAGWQLYPNSKMSEDVIEAWKQVGASHHRPLSLFVNETLLYEGEYQAIASFE